MRRPEDMPPRTFLDTSFGCKSLVVEFFINFCPWFGLGFVSLLAASRRLDPLFFPAQALIVFF